MVGQFTFTKGDQNPTGQVLGGASGIAWAGNRLFVADSNRLGASPNDSRVMVFDTTLIPGLETDVASFSPVQGLTSCMVCGTPASFLLGQNTLTPPTYIPSGQTTPVVAYYSGHDGGEDQAGTQPAENAWLYNATAVASDGNRFAIADTDNNRILLWNSVPTSNTHPDLVIGQPDFSTLQQQQLGVVTATAMRGPQGVWIANNKLYVADTQNNRVLIWNSWPTKNNQTPDVVLGQVDFTHATAPTPSTTPPTTTATALLNPTSVTADGGHVFVSDLGFNRVLIWNTISPTIDQPADVVVGQADFKQTTSNNATVCLYPGSTNSLPLGSQGQCQSSLNFPRFALSDGTRLFVADGGNDRVLIFNTIPTANGKLADQVLGQTNFINDIVTSVSISIVSTEVDNTGGVDTTPTPTSLAWDGTNLYVADPFNRRVLLFTPADSLVPSAFDTTASVIPVVNWGSEIVRQEATVIFSVTTGGKITAGDTASITIAGVTPAYTYTEKAGDTVDTIAKQLVAKINASDQNVTATFGGPGTGTVYLSSIDKSGAEVTSLGYDTISLAAAASNVNNITVTTSGNYLSAGNAATASPGTLVEINAPSNVFFTDSTLAYTAPLTGTIPTSVNGVELFTDGIASPLYKVSQKQLVGQIPYSFSDRNSTSVYVRTVHSDGNVTVTSATPVYIAPANPGIFSAQQYPGQPRPWPISQARHQLGNPVAVVSLDGTATLNDEVAVYVNGSSTPYTYTVTAADIAATNPLQSVLNNLITAMANDPYVIPSAGGAFTRLILTARNGAFDATTGNGIPISVTTGTVSGGLSTCSTTVSATETLTPYNSTGNDALCHATVNTCCAVASGTQIFPGNPAVPGELISIAVAGMGLLQDQNGNANISTYLKTGVAYNGLPMPGNNITSFNDVLSANFVAATIGTSSAQYTSAGLDIGSYGIYRVDVLVPSSAASNPQTPFYIAQNAFISNTVYLPIGSAVANPPSPPPVVPASPIDLSIDAPVTPQLNQVTVINGTFKVYGWAVDADSSVTNVALQIDGVTVANLTKANGGYGASRPDVCVTHPTVFDCPNVGYSYNLDTTTLANGGHTLQVLVTDSAGRNRANPQGVNIFIDNDPLQSKTHVSIDTPTTYGQIYHGVVMFAGWATNDVSAIVPGSFKASIDGFEIPASQITYGLSRPDVCAVAVAGTPGCTATSSNVGWSYLADLTKLANSNATPGTLEPHTFTMTAVAANGQYITVSSSFYVNNYDPIDLYSGPAGNIDVPSATAGNISGTVQLWGWAIDSYTNIVSVQYSIDGGPMNNVPYGIGRPDVCTAYSIYPNFDLSNCPYVGFNGTLDTTTIPDGPHVLGITATPYQGQPYTMTQNIVVSNLDTTANPVRITIDNPAEITSTLTTLSGTALVRGWTITDSSSNSAIASVTIAVDGVPAGTATYGDQRTDVCAVYPGRPGCPNVGFHYSLDTTHLTNGTHVLEVTSATVDGKRASASASFKVSNTSANAHTVIESPNATSLPISGIAITSGWALNTGVAINSLNITVDGVPVGTTTLNIARTDVCTSNSSPNCPNVGWSFFFDTNALIDGAHILGVTAVAADGTVNTANATFTVQNWSSGAALTGSIDTPNPGEPYYTGKVTLAGWLLQSNVSVPNVSIAIDGIPFGNATKVARGDVALPTAAPIARTQVGHSCLTPVC